MAAHRFYAPGATRAGETVALPPGEAHQLRHVLRLRRDATVQAFDGRGHEFLARVRSVGREGVSIHTLEAVEPAREPAVNLEVALALLKGRAAGAVVRDATMLGAASIQPLTTERTLGGRPGRPRGREHAEGAVGRWQAIAVSSAKQCRRAVVPLVKPPLSFPRLLARGAPGLAILLVEPAAGAPAASLRRVAERPAPERATVAVGPEGGWTAAEVEAAADAGFLPLTLGARTLRAEAAPAAALAVLQYVWGDL